jgi:hypothetical protein
MESAGHICVWDLMNQYLPLCILKGHQHDMCADFSWLNHMPNITAGPSNPTGGKSGYNGGGGGGGVANGSYAAASSSNQSMGSLLDYGDPGALVSSLLGGSSSSSSSSSSAPALSDGSHGSGSGNGSGSSGGGTGGAGGGTGGRGAGAGVGAGSMSQQQRRAASRTAAAGAGAGGGSLAASALSVATVTATAASSGGFSNVKPPVGNSAGAEAQNRRKGQSNAAAAGGAGGSESSNSSTAAVATKQLNPLTSLVLGILSAGRDGKLLMQDLRFGYFPNHHISPSVTAISSQGHVAYQRGYVHKVCMSDICLTFFFFLFSLFSCR